MPDPMTEPAAILAAREVLTKLHHSPGPLQTEQAISQFPLEARGRCQDGCARQLAAAHPTSTRSFGHSEYASICSSVMATTVMPVAKTTPGKPITTKATYYATTTFVPVFGDLGYDDIQEDCSYYNFDNTIRNEAKFTKAFRSACSCAGITPTIATMTKPVPLRTPGPRPTFAFDGLFKLRAHIQDGGKDSWVNAFEEVPEMDLRLAELEFGEELTYFRQIMPNLRVGIDSTSRPFLGTNSFEHAPYMFRAIEHEDIPEKIVFLNNEENYDIKSRERLIVFIVREEKKKGAPAYFLKARSLPSETDLSPDGDALEFILFEERICVADAQWALDFLRGDLSEYSRDNLTDYRYLSLEAVPVVEGPLD